MINIFTTFPVTELIQFYLIGIVLTSFSVALVSDDWDDKGLIFLAFLWPLTLPAGLGTVLRMILKGIWNS